MIDESKQSIIIIEGEADLNEVARDLAQAKVDEDACLTDFEKADRDLEKTPESADPSEAMIADEVASAARVVKEYEADAVARGLALKMSGVRYKIYETITE